jgi:hypothetical protein
MTMFSRTVLLLLATSLWWSPSLAASYMDKNTYSVQGETIMARRERNLDHWNSDTLAYYLDEYPGYDVAIMFYASWDQNSHALAPYWDRIATLVDAGNEQSRLIMALFDCELNDAHNQLCEALSITHYPTLMFVGSGPYHDTDPFFRTLFGSRSAGRMGESPVPNTVKFQGNWQYGDAILDWIRTMQALSNWHTWSTQGFGKRLRNFLLPQKAPNPPLPVGVPGVKRGGGEMAPTAPSGAADPARVKTLESQVEKMFNVTADYEKMLSRSDIMLASVLSSTADQQDMFTLLDQEKAWEAMELSGGTATPRHDILRNCVAEIALNYCQRVSTQAATELVDDLEKLGMTAEEMLAMEDLEGQVMDRISKAEPYCAILDTCVLTSFKEEACRPKTCPFENEAACRYLTACLDPSLQQEYAEALGLSLETPKTITAYEDDEDAADEGTQKKRWGM